MRLGQSLAVLTALAYLAGCSGVTLQSQDSAVPVVPLDQIIGSMKCGLAQAILADRQRGRAGVLGGVAKVVLKANVIQGRTLNGSVSATGIPISTNRTLGAGLGLNKTSTITTNTTIKFNFDLSSANSAVCETAYAYGYDGGFSPWFLGVISALNETVAGAPKVQLQDYEYDTNFVVTSNLTANADAGLQFSIVPVKVHGDVSASRSDIQHINIKIDAVHIDGGFLREGGKPFGKISPAVPKEVQIPKGSPTCIEVVGGDVKKGAKPFATTLKPAGDCKYAY